MKYFTVLLIILLSVINGYSQKLAVELSIRWENESNFLKIHFQETNKPRPTPYLCITYRNLTNENIYFKKVMDDNTLPVTGGLAATHMIEALKQGKQPVSFSQYSMDEEYIVLIGNTVHFTNTWLVRKDTIKEVYITPYINDEIETINFIIKIQKYLNSKHPHKQIPFFVYPNKKTISYKAAHRLMLDDEVKKNKKIQFGYAMLDSTRIMSQVVLNDKFCFLKKDGVFTQKVSLLSFMLLGGSYTFLLENKTFYRYVIAPPVWNDSKNKWEQKKTRLPEHINDYHLYTGNFLTNSVKIKFKTYKKKPIAIGDSLSIQ